MWPVRRLLLILLVVLVNLPAAHERWTDHEVSAKGRDVVAEVVDGRRTGGRNLVDYRLPSSADPKRTVYSASLERGAYDRAMDTRDLAVRAVPGDPGANRPEGEVANPLFLVVAIGADVMLLVVLALARYRRKHPVT